MTINKTFMYMLFFYGSLCFQTNSVIIEGFVFDDKTNEKLIGVFISIADSGVAITNKDGYFSFKINAGTYKVTAGMVGYEKENKKVSIDYSDEESKLFFRLTPKPIEITQVTVTGEKFTENVKYKTYELHQGDLRRIPQVGEPDALRALQVLPGVTSLNDFSSQMYLRGGNFDETLIALDDVPVYNPYHLGGTFSMFNTDIIETQKLYLSIYPSKYGGYLSGAFNIKTKPGNREKFKGSVSIGLISSKGYIETPIGKGSLILSGRRTYLDLIGAFVFEGDFPYYFYDTYAKFIYPFDKQNLLSVSGFYSRDIFKIYKERSYSNTKISEQPNWGNKIFNFKYSHFYGEKNSIDAQIYLSSSTMYGKGESIFQSSSSTLLNINNRINDLTGTIVFNHSASGHDIQAGIEYKNIELKNNWNIGRSELSDFGFDLEDTFFDFAPNPYSSKANSSFYNYFISDKIQFSKDLSVNLGLRGSYLNKLQKNLFSPSVNIEYNVKYNVELILNYGKYYQNMSVIKDQSSVLLDPFSIYFFPSKKSELANSDNFSLNINFTNIYNGIDLELGSYYNIRSNLTSTYTQTSAPYRLEDGYSRGIDVLAKKDFGDFGGWISYSFSRSIKSNNDYDYPVRADRTHNVKILFNINLSESWHFTSFWTFASGTPYTKRVGAYLGEAKPELEDQSYFDVIFYWLPIDGKKNAERTESYHRLDIGFNGSFIWGSFYVKPYLQVLNIYNSPNPTVDNLYFDFYAKQTKRASFVTPTIGLRIEF